MVSMWVCLVLVCVGSMALPQQPPPPLKDQSTLSGETQQVSKENATPVDTATASALSNTAPHSRTISLCVPCIPRDQVHLDNLLRDVAEQTVKPMEVVVAMSEISEQDGKQLEQRLNNIWSPTRVLATAKQAGPGENRNRAAKAATGELVLFMDADDKMHPIRNEYLLNVQQKTHAKCIVHSNSVRCKKLLPIPPEALIIEGDVIYQKTKEHYNGLRPERGGVYPAYTPMSLNKPVNGVASGQIMCERGVFDHVQYISDLRGEDNIFLKSVLLHYGPKKDSLVFLHADLLSYFPSNNPANQAEYGENVTRGCAK